jgi:hypothetical protein
MPGAIWVFLVGMLFPLIAMIVLSFRAILLYNAVRDSCYQASIEQSYSEGVTKAQDVLKKDAEAFTGVKIAANQPRVSIITKRLSDGFESESKNKLGSGTVNTLNNQYFIRTYVNAEIEPMINLGTTGFWNNIPGLTKPIVVTDMIYQVFAENPNGLES